MRFILKFFMSLSFIGLALSIAAHAMALAEMEIPGGQFIWALHGGIFIVWIPTVLVSIRATRNVSRNDFWKAALSGCPPWMKRALSMLFAYAIANFIVFAVSAPNAAHSLTNEVRGFSGHWMIFYAAAFAVLYSALHTPLLFNGRKCPLGHAVDPAANYCPTCGHALTHEFFGD